MRNDWKRHVIRYAELYRQRYPHVHLTEQDFDNEYRQQLQKMRGELNLVREYYCSLRKAILRKDSDSDDDFDFGDDSGDDDIDDDGSGFDGDDGGDDTPSWVNQPRDADGRWTSEGGIQTADAGNIATDAQVDGNDDTQVAATSNSVTLQYPDGSSETRTGGSISWRNNNPGNLISGTFADANGAIGSNAGFAVFPDEETGQDASAALLKMPVYSQLTIDGAIARRSPPSSNNTEAVQAAIRQIGGFTGTEIVGQLDNNQFLRLVDAIQQDEKWQEGTIVYTPAPKQ